MIPFAATAITWLRAFKGPCAILAGVALLAGGWGGFAIAWKLQAGNVAKAELRLAEFTGQLAANAAAGQAEARRLATEAAQAESDRQGAIMAALSQGFSGVLAQVRRDNLTLRESIRAPQYDCLRNEPLPADALRLLRRPGGRAEPAGDRPDSGPAATP